MSRALDLASEALSRGEFPVGCVLVSGDDLVGLGARTHSRAGEQNELDHAEVLAVRDWISRGSPVDVGDPFGLTAYCTLEPCLMCMGALILSGVKRIVFAYEDVMGGAAGIDFSSPLTAGAGKGRVDSAALGGRLYFPGAVEIQGGVMRGESLRLFKEFYADPACAYWQDSLLSRYTVEAEE
jgi:tRNA(adenine34) deaminase